GTSNGGTCSGTSCDTQSYVNAVNAAALCGYTDWRMPTYRELLTLVHHGVQNPSIDATFFPNTQPWAFWSGSSYVPVPEGAWSVVFFDGYPFAYYKTNANYVRLVRGGQF